MPGNPIDLSSAPEAIFEQNDWRRLIELVGDRASAIERLGYQEAGAHLFVRQELAMTLGAPGNRARREEAAFEVRDRLLHAFKSGLLTGRFVLTAFAPGSAIRQTIPPDLAARLHFDFVSGVASSIDIRLSGVRIEPPPVSAHRLVDRVFDWLTAEPGRATSAKKTLAFEAREHFGGLLTTRVFDAAYSQAFARPRGRPRKGPGKSAE